MESLIWLAPICAVVALLFAAYKTAVVSKAPGGNDRMQEIASAISEGARAFLYSEYKILAIFIVVVFVLIGLFISWETGICFVVGAVFSICAGFFGMNVATKANVRTAQAAMDGGMNKALGVAFSGGSVMGMCVVGLGLLGASVIYIITGDSEILFGFSWVLPPLRCSRVSAAVSTPRRQMSVPISWARWKPASLRTIPATPPLLRIMWAITWAMSPVWALICLSPMSARLSPP